RLAAGGTSFLARARDLLAAHDHALAGVHAVDRRLTIGISDHVAGPGLASLITRVNAFDPLLRLDVRINFSHALLEQFDGGELDAVIVRREGNRRGGEYLLEDEFAWFAAANFPHKPGEKLRPALLAAPFGAAAPAHRRAAQ